MLDAGTGKSNLLSPASYLQAGEISPERDNRSAILVRQVRKSDRNSFLLPR
jgi:hypothetical protein